MEEKKIEKILNILNGVANNSMDPVQGLKDWPDIDTESDDLIAASWHDLSHFANDEDIRQKDKKYESLLKENLIKRYKEINKKFGSS